MFKFKQVLKNANNLKFLLHYYVHVSYANSLKEKAGGRGGDVLNIVSNHNVLFDRKKF